MEIRIVRPSVCLGLVLLIPLPALADEVRPASSIESVIVYAEGASVTRRVPITLPAGASTIILENLPAELETNSLKVDGSENAYQVSWPANESVVVLD